MVSVQKTISKLLLLCFQPVPEHLDMREKAIELLQKNDFEKKRARTMDIDDFLE